MTSVFRLIQTNKAYCDLFVLSALRNALHQCEMPQNMKQIILFQDSFLTGCILNVLNIEYVFWSHQMDFLQLKICKTTNKNGLRHRTSAYPRASRMFSHVSILCRVLVDSLVLKLMRTIKSRSDSKQPCFSPNDTRNYSVLPMLTFTLHYNKSLFIFDDDI